MPYPQRPLVTSYTFLAVALLSGCGGGDGDGGFSAPDINTALVEITTENQEEVVAVAYDSVSGSSETAGSLPIAAVVDSEGAAKIALLATVSEQIDRALRRGKPQADTTVSAVSFSESVSCEYYNPATQSWVTQGSIRVSGDVADTDSFETEVWSSGDTATMTFDNCAFDPGESINGSVSFTISGDFDASALDNPGQCTSPCTVSLSVTINSFSLTMAGEGTATIHGNMMLDRVITPTTLSETTSSNSLWFVSSNGFAMNFSDLETTKSLNLNNSTYAYDSTITIASTDIDGRIQVSAQLSGTLSGFSYDTYEANDPDAGTLSIIGANGQLTANVNGNTLTLQLDIGNDGTVDGETAITWTQLDQV